MNIIDITLGSLSADLKLLADAGKPPVKALPTYQDRVTCPDCGQAYIQANWFPRDHWLYPLATQVAAAYGVYQAERLIKLAGQDSAYKIKKATPCACD